VALLEKRRYLNNRSGDFPQVILIVPSHVPNKGFSYYFCLMILAEGSGSVPRSRVSDPDPHGSALI
jgi:hypothetical protein